MTRVNATFIASLPENANVGDVFTLTGQAHIYAIESDLIDVSTSEPQFIPGERRYKIVVTDAKFDRKPT